jgi:hypothetical protein
MMRVDARRIAIWQKQGRDVYLYFNNDIGAAVVQSALELGRLLSQPSTALDSSELCEFSDQDSVYTLSGNRLYFLEGLKTQSQQ